MPLWFVLDRGWRYYDKALCRDHLCRLIRVSGGLRIIINGHLSRIYG